MSEGSGRRDVPLEWLLGVGAMTLLWPLIEWAGRSIALHYHPAQTVGMRYAVHVAVLAVTCLPFGVRRMVVTRHLGGQIARGLCMFLMPASFVVSVSRMDAAVVWSVFWIAPLVVLALARWWLREQLPVRQWAFAALAYAGTLLVFGAPRDVGVDTVLPVVAALSFAVYVVLSRRLRDEWIGASLFYTAGAALAATLPFMVAWWRPLHAEDAVPILALGAFSVAFLFCLDRALVRAPAWILAPLLYLVVVWETFVEILRAGRMAARGGGGKRAGGWRGCCRLAVGARRSGARMRSMTVSVTS